MFEIVSGLWCDDIQRFDTEAEAMYEAQKIADAWNEWVEVREVREIAIVKPRPLP